MSTINVSMPESLRAYVEAQAQSGGYTVSEYIRHLVRQDRDDREALVLEWGGAVRESMRQLDRGEVSARGVSDIFDSAKKAYLQAGDARPSLSD